MGFQKIGILSIGEMGFHWAKLLKSRGVEVLTYRGEELSKGGGGPTCLTRPLLRT